MLVPETDQTSMFKHIVKCAQTCYKVDKEVDKPLEWIKTNLLSKSPRHLSPLEHGTAYLTIQVNNTPSEEMDRRDKIVLFYATNKYSHVNIYESHVGYTAYITTNYRVIEENLRWDDLIYITKPFKKHEKRYTFRFSCDIGVSREANRHRTISPSEQSTRYCNYSNDRFGNSLQIVLPTELFDAPDEELTPLKLDGYCAAIADGKDNLFTDIDWWMFANIACEVSYMNLIRLGWKPQQARRILPLDTHTEVVYTAFEKDWEHFIHLRDDKAAHPDMRFLARQVHIQLLKETEKYR
jgi:thymidylate synthase (FAD)